MEIPKEQILDLLRQQGKHDQASQAQQELPDQVDTDQHADLLAKFGIDPTELIGKLGGNIPGL
jgi:DNA-binding protein H-NS